MLALGAAGLLAWGWSRLGSDGATTPYRFETLASRRGVVSSTVTATGSLQPLAQVEVGPELSGRVTRVLVDFNQRVAAGQILCELDPEQWQAAVRQARAQLAANQAALESGGVTLGEARVEAERSRQLSAAGIASQQSLDAARATLRKAEAAVRVAEAQVELARAALESARTSLSKAVIRSPIDGIVLSRAVEPGQAVAASLQAPVLFVLARDLDRMELHIEIDEADIGRVAEGQSASFVVDAYPDRTFEATLSGIHNIATVDNNVVSYEAVLRVENAEGRLRPGMTATVTVVTARQEDALLVPNRALRFVPPSALEAPDRQGPPNPFAPKRSAKRSPSRKDPSAAAPRVWTLGEAGAPVAISLRTGMTDGEWTEVRGGALQAGIPLLVDATKRGK